MTQKKLILKAENYSADYILSKALDIAEVLLKNGGESHRIEDTVNRICSAYGASQTDVFALPSVINASVRMPDGTHSSQVRRVYFSSNNMFMLDKANDLSHSVCNGTVPIEDVERLISDMESSKPFPKYLIFLGSILGAGGFAIFFGGDFSDALVASLAGIVISLLNLKKFRFINQIVHTLVLSFFGAVTAQILLNLGVGHNPDMVMIGTIMLLIPGLSFGNAIRDLILGDTISGIIQLVQAVLIAVTVAFGFALSMVIFGGGALW